MHASLRGLTARLHAGDGGPRRMGGGRAPQPETQLFNNPATGQANSFMSNNASAGGGGGGGGGPAAGGGGGGNMGGIAGGPVYGYNTMASGNIVGNMMPQGGNPGGGMVQGGGQQGFAGNMGMQGQQMPQVAVLGQTGGMGHAGQGQFSGPQQQQQQQMGYQQAPQQGQQQFATMGYGASNVADNSGMQGGGQTATGGYGAAAQSAMATQYQTSSAGYGSYGAAQQAGNNAAQFAGGNNVAQMYGQQGGGAAAAPPVSNQPLELAKSVQQRISQVVMKSAGMVKFDHFDTAVCAMLSQLPVPKALAALNQLEVADKRNAMNMQALIVSLIQQQ